MAPAETTTTSAEYVSVASPRFTTRRVTSRPDAPVSSFVTWASVSRVTFGSRSAGSTQTTWASDLAPTRHGWPSQVSQRMQRLPRGSASSSMIPSGTWKGRRPSRAQSSCSRWMRGSWLTGECGYGALAGGSVGSTPRSPCT